MIFHTSLNRIYTRSVGVFLGTSGGPLNTAALYLFFSMSIKQAAEKLYHSYMVFNARTKRVGALIKGREYYVRVDVFNENGVTIGKTIKMI